MTLDELRKLRDAMVAAKEKWIVIPHGAPDEYDAHVVYDESLCDYEAEAVEYVDKLIDALPPEGK